MEGQTRLTKLSTSYSPALWKAKAKGKLQFEKALASLTRVNPKRVFAVIAYKANLFGEEEKAWVKMRRPSFMITGKQEWCLNESASFPNRQSTRKNANAFSFALLRVHSRFKQKKLRL